MEDAKIRIKDLARFGAISEANAEFCNICIGQQSEIEALKKENQSLKDYIASMSKLEKQEGASD
jgi:uncharacterized protein YdcH (DUF465 family)